MNKRAYLVMGMLILAALACVGGLGGNETSEPVQVVQPSPTPPPIPTAAMVTPTIAVAEPEPEDELIGATGTATLVYSTLKDGLFRLFIMDDQTRLIKEIPLPDDIQNPIWPDVHPDGTRVVFATVGGSNRFRPNGLYIANLDGSEAHQITYGDGNHPQWSPDGTQIAFSCNESEDICIINPDGSGFVNITEDTSGYSNYPSWTRDGRLVFMSNRDVNQNDRYSEIYIMDATGENVDRLTYDRWNYNVYPRVSPSGDRIVFESDADSGYGSEIYVMNLDGSNVRRITNDTAWNQNPAWSFDGAHVYYSSKTDFGSYEVYTIPVDVLTMPQQLTFNYDENGGLRMGLNGLRYPIELDEMVLEEEGLPELSTPRGSQAMNNKIIFATNSFNCPGCLETGIYTIDSDASDMVKTDIEGLYPAFAPDFKRIAYVYEGEVYIAASNGSNITKITQNLLSMSAPVWRGDENVIVTTCKPYGYDDICLLDMETGLINNITEQMGFGPGEPFPSWYLGDILIGDMIYDTAGNEIGEVDGVGRISPNGRFLATIIGGQIAVVSLDSGEAEIVTSSNSTKGFPVWSPNGRHLLYTMAPGDGYLYLGVVEDDGDNEAKISPPIAEGPTYLPNSITTYLGYSWGT